MSTRSVVADRFGLRFARDVVERAARGWRRRRMVGRLAALDDHLLADMGITRQDILSVLAEPLLVDPSERLAERARDMRRARHAALRESFGDPRFADQLFLPRDDDRRAA